MTSEVRHDSAHRLRHQASTGHERLGLYGEWSKFFAPGTPVLALPSWTRPRLLINGASASHRWRASALFPASRRHARAWRWAVRASAWSGLGVARLPDDTSSRWLDMVRAAFPDAMTSAVFIGAPSLVQKLTVQVSDRSGEALAYLKYGRSDPARHLLASERQVLTQLRDDLAPACIAFGEFDGGSGLLTTAVRGRRYSAALAGLEGAKAFVDRLPTWGTDAISVHPWIVGLQRKTSVDLTPIISPLDDRSWSIVLQHGDYAPWNLIQEPSGRIRAIDWEYGTLYGLPHVDLAYYVLQLGALVYRWTPGKTLDVTSSALQRLYGSQLDRGQAMAICRLAALDAHWKGRTGGWSDDSWLQAWRARIWTV